MATSIFELGKIPDFLRDLRPYDGKPSELINWLMEAECIVNQIYADVDRNSLQFDLAQKTIRRKIIGEAADVLNSNNVTSDWEDIKSTLLHYYSDKRELKTLDHELSIIKKSPTECISSYYSRVNELLSAIVAAVQTDANFVGHTSSHINYFRDKALDSFIRGLEKNLSMLLKTANPKSLAKAYQFCMDYYNMDARNAPYRGEHSGTPTPKPRTITPPVPPPRQSRLYNTLPPPPPRQPIYRNQFHPQNRFTNHINPTHHPTFRTQPEPMDIDRSIRSRTVNYGNRPPVDLKRPRPPSSRNAPFNYKRQAHPLENLDPPPDMYAGYQYQNNPEYYPHYSDDYTDEHQHQPHQQYQYYRQSQSEIPQHEQSHQQRQSPEEQTYPSQANFLEWKESW